MVTAVMETIRIRHNFLPEDLKSCNIICTLKLSLYHKISSCNWYAVWFCLEYNLVAKHCQHNVHVSWVLQCSLYWTIIHEWNMGSNKYIVTSYVES